MLESKSAPYTFVKQGTYYFTRRVPSDLAHHYNTPRITYSLRTRSAAVALGRANRAAQQLDEFWYHLRVRDVDLPGKHLLRANVKAALDGTAISGSVSCSEFKLSEAVAIYIRLKGKDRPKTFRQAAERAGGYVIDACGDKDLAAYTRTDATSFRDALISKGLVGSSITRVFGTVRSVFNFAAGEMGLTMSNPFSGVYYDRDAGVEDRQPLSVKYIRSLQALCREQDDDLRWLVALLSDTGMRLAEATGLGINDIRLDGPTPFVVVEERPWRRLKTKGSSREIPLVGASLWAAERVVSEVRQGHFAFPRYNKASFTNANSASAALNKWMKCQANVPGTLHCFRHSMRDRLRAVECPSDVADQIGGWQTEGVGQAYGRGYPLEVLSKWMKVAVSFKYLK